MKNLVRIIKKSSLINLDPTLCFGNKDGTQIDSEDETENWLLRPLRSPENASSPQPRKLRMMSVFVGYGGGMSFGMGYETFSFHMVTVCLNEQGNHTDYKLRSINIEELMQNDFIFCVVGDGFDSSGRTTIWKK